MLVPAFNLDYGDLAPPGVYPPKAGPGLLCGVIARPKAASIPTKIINNQY